MRKIRLFCFPYAGGSSMVFNHWEEYLDSHITLFPVELAGRGKRINESLYDSVAEAADDVIRKIRPCLYDLPFAFFGHSMGGGIAYQVALKLRELNYPQPKHIFFSGRGAPHIKRLDVEPYYSLPDEEFKAKLLELGGTPKEFFEHPELLKIILPLVRTDLRISWLFTHQFGEIDPLDCDITVLTGEDDDINPEQLQGWLEHTHGTCNINSFEGGHFFINDPLQKEQIFKIINQTLYGSRRLKPLQGSPLL
jgi:surfactin synthase thioesterase subunit